MMVPTDPQEKPAPSEELHLVDEDVEFRPEQLEFQPPKEEEQVKPEDIPQPEAVDMYDAPVDLRVVEDLPQFPGGAVEFMKWLTKNLKYPPNAQNRKVQGRVMAQFVINKDGSISDLELVEKLDPWCDREALRVLRMMPKWEPGVMDAKPCRTLVAIPIYFKL
jgi:protein TonB